MTCTRRGVFLFILLLILALVAVFVSTISWSSSPSTSPNKDSIFGKTDNTMRQCPTLRPIRQHITNERDDELLLNFLKPPVNSSFSTGGEQRCLTYSQRYEECSRVRKLPLRLQRKLFTAVATASSGTVGQPAREVALLRLHKRPWPQRNETRREKLDIWLHVCSFILEVGRENRYAGDSESWRRDVVLYTLEGHEGSVPYEFQDLVHSHSEEMLHQLYKHPIYSGGGYERGDLAAHLFLRLHHQYVFAWVIEYDVRYIGASWGEFLARARRYSRERTMQQAGISPIVYESQPLAKTRRELLLRFKTELEQKDKMEKFIRSGWIAKHYNPRNVSSIHYVPMDYSSPSSDNRNNESNNKSSMMTSSHEYFSDAKGDAHLIWFYPPLLNYGFVKFNCSTDSRQPGCPPSPQFKREPFTQWHFGWRDFFVGQWQNYFVNNRPWIGAFAPAFGFSRTLAEAVDAEARAYRNHVNQEVALPITAQLYKLKIIPVYGGTESMKHNSQFYYAWSKPKESAPYYLGWMNGTISARTMKNRYSEFADTATDKEFDGSDCLSNFLFHPVKL